MSTVQSVIPVHPTADPESCLNRQIAAFMDSAEPECCFIIEYPFTQYYLPNNPVVQLLAAVVLRRPEAAEDDCSIASGIAERTADLLREFATAETAAQLKAIFTSHGNAWFDLCGPLRLEPVTIPKPWGREIWFTGIEARGQSMLASGANRIPLPWLLSLAPQRLVSGLAQKLTLLKILDPLPEEVYGDLYFEMHEQKQEVYVVTHVDREAWKTGVGGIRFGFDTTKRAQFASDEAFRQAYLKAVKAYEKVRREIDSSLDEKRREEGIGLDEPVAAETTKRWQQTLPNALRVQEQQRRRAMESFTAMKPLHKGDVVKVPCFTPHSLQHGVRTVEFQTPVYERKILSFAQKVLTQSNWDTEQAVARMQLDNPVQPPLTKLASEQGVVVEQVVEFDDFRVYRVTLAAGACWRLDSPFAYAVVMSIAGEIVLSASAIEIEKRKGKPLEIETIENNAADHWLLLNEEQAALLPAGLHQPGIYNRADTTAIALLSLPVQRTFLAHY